ncbi:SMP-30/gluconolactonase/LRE family protein [Allosaccharopolyspora coralli]|uniref:SMP-30/gluconolactonase/LRE family protein n=2 Tax=Allosaccharopolyspora coralli TaxID=2665642 RepID=A0A5Q3QMM7_9PSEU|nr:SMP-30/gluconolactonase/LRE family protein [Allosaccharopolyspora coralli]
MSGRVEVAVAAGAREGGAPTWDVGWDTLLWVDRAADESAAGTVHRHVPGGANHSMELAQRVGAAKPRGRGGLVLHLDEGVAVFEADGQRRTWLTYWARDGVRSGATAVDRAGRLWATTVREDESGGGWLARVLPDGSASAVLTDLPAANGLAFDAEANRLYLADSATGLVEILDVEHESGAVGPRHTFVQVEDGEPAGLCVDGSGAVWLALRDAGQVRRYTPEGELDTTVDLPLRRPLGCCFGGPELADLYVTSAPEGLAEPGEDDGAVLVLRGVGPGVRPYAFAG